MILAAGQGTRLRPLTDVVPKPMIPIAGLPLLAHTLTWLASQGVDEAAINLYHRPEDIPRYFGHSFSGVKLHYFFEEFLLGTAGGLKAAAAVFANETFCVIYGDNLIFADLRRVMAFHAERKGLVTIGLFTHPNPTSAGIVGLDATGRVTAFVEKPAPDRVFSHLANAGIYVCSPEILDHIPTGASLDFGRDVFPDILLKGLPLYGKVIEGYVQDTGTPNHYRQANWDVLDGLTGLTPTPLVVRAGGRIHESVTWQGRNVVGCRAVIEAGVRITDCILWDDVHIGPGCDLEGSILASGVIIPAGSVLRGNILAA